MFGLTGEVLANLVRAAARAARLWDGFSSHTSRVGMAQRTVAAGAPNAAVQNQGRWCTGIWPTATREANPLTIH